METFKLEVYAYPINNNDWEKRHSFYFDAEKFEMEKHSDDGYFTVKVTAADGTVTARELFYGTLTKSVQNRETKQTVAVTGTIVDELRNCIMQKEGWLKLCGKKLKVTNAVEVPIIRRGWNGQPDRATTTTVYSIDVVE